MCSLVGGSRVEKILRTAREALHCNEVLACDDVENIAGEGDLERPREDLWIHISQATEEIDLIAVLVGENQIPQHGIVIVPAMKPRAEAVSTKFLLQLFQTLEIDAQEGVNISRRTHGSVHCQRESADHGIVDPPAAQDFDDIQEQKRGLTRSLGSHGLRGGRPRTLSLSTGRVQLTDELVVFEKCLQSLLRGQVAF